jgi:hypothetical protein
MSCSGTVYNSDNGVSANAPDVRSRSFEDATYSAEAIFGKIEGFDDGCHFSVRETVECCIDLDYESAI